MNRHNAPSVVYPLGRSSFLGWLLLGGWCAGAFSTLLWWRAMQQFDWRIGLALLAVLVSGFAARSSWNRLPEGQLVWDGDLWRWESAGYQSGTAEQKVVVIADFQYRLLLRLQNDAHANLWLCAEKSAMPERWLDFRRAVYSPHKSAESSKTHDFFPVEPLSSSTSLVAVSTDMPSVNTPRVPS